MKSKTKDKEATRMFYSSVKHREEDETSSLRMQGQMDIQKQARRPEGETDRGRGAQASPSNTDNRHTLVCESTGDGQNPCRVDEEGTVTRKIPGYTEKIVQFPPTRADRLQHCPHLGFQIGMSWRTPGD